MKGTTRNTSGLALGLVIVAGILTASASAFALDAYQDRRGLFTGIGLGGGAAFEGGGTGGAALIDLQLGGGATRDLTFDMDLDIWFQLMDHHDNWMITPGPEINYFITDGLFVRGGLGLALVFVTGEKVKDPVPGGGKSSEQNDFTIGFDGSLGLGYEFFVNSNLALGMAVEGDYVVLKGDDVGSVNFSMELKYY
jgi:hypothetical protein